MLDKIFFIILGKCKINRKRVDRVFSDWERKVIETLNEWKEFMEKTVLVEAAHGGMKLSIPVGQTFVNFRFIHVSLNWTEAQRNCETLGGQLFFKLDGSTEQLEDFVGRTASGRYWIGIHREAPGLTSFFFVVLRLGCIFISQLF